VGNFDLIHTLTHSDCGHSSGTKMRFGDQAVDWSTRFDQPPHRSATSLGQHYCYPKHPVRFFHQPVTKNLTRSFQNFVKEKSGVIGDDLLTWTRAPGGQVMEPNRWVHVKDRLSKRILAP
jgi:hypothetical protein